MKTIEDYRMYFSPDEDEFKGWVSGHIFAEVLAENNDSVLSFEVDDYRPTGEWDVKQWEARQGYIRVLVNQGKARDAWKLGFRLARTLVRQGMAQIANGVGEVFRVNLPVEISITL